ncbi:chromosomal replication initiator protein DnaA [Acetobacteraceae bacterium]|nr:chromosomal replication initiator protein DnaA [Acetobacteraceae bacterium]
MGVDELSLIDGKVSIPEAVLHAWERVKLRLQKQMEKGGAAGKVQFYSWIHPISLSALKDGEVFLSLPTPFMCAYVRDHFGDLLHALWLEEGLGSVSGVEFYSPSSEKVNVLEVTSPEHLDEKPKEAAAISSVKIEEKRSPVNSLNPHYSFENFIVDKPNEVAHVCAKRVAEHPNSQGFNPLVLHGGVGLGKTHLMQAIGNEVSKDKTKTVEYMTADTFMYRYTNSLRAQRQNDFKEELISVDLLMIDDVQFLIGKTRTQEEFFNIFNELKSAGKQIVLTTDRSPHNQADFDDRVRSRLASGMIAALYDTTFELRLSILQAKAEDANVVFSEKVLEFLAHKITTNVRELEGAFNRLMAHATLMDRPITLEAAQDILKDMLRLHERVIGIDEIKRLVGDEWNVRLAQMNGKQRSKKIARPRQVAMYLSKVLTRHSLPEIGKKFERDHTTVMHAIRRVEQEMAEDPDFAEKVEQVQRMLKTGPSDI